MCHPRSYVRILVLATAIAACLATTSAVALAGPQPSHGQTVHTEERNTSVVLTALQVVFNEHRIDQIDRYFTEDFIQHSPLVSPDNAGRDGLKQWLTSIVTAIPDLTYLPGDPMADGDRVMVFADVHGTIQADLPAYGIKGSGQRLQVSTAQVFRLVHGKIAEHWEVVDTGPLLQVASDLIPPRLAASPR
jgi:predicted SnoaL-like aldol condensation-catalyzing enzyme